MLFLLCAKNLTAEAAHMLSNLDIADRRGEVDGVADHPPKKRKVGKRSFHEASAPRHRKRQTMSAAGVTRSSICRALWLGAAVLLVSPSSSTVATAATAETVSSELPPIANSLFVFSSQPPQPSSNSTGELRRVLIILRNFSRK